MALTEIGKQLRQSRTETVKVGTLPVAILIIADRDIRPTVVRSTANQDDVRIAQLTEHHCKKLVPASEVLHIAVIIYPITQSSMLRWSSEKLTATFTTFRPSSAKALA